MKGINMRNVHINYPDSHLTFQYASLLAREAARQNLMQEPTIMAWHTRSGISPRFEGGNPGAWWEKYGTGNGGRLEISVGEEYAFIMMDARGYETLVEIPLRNLSDSEGKQYICFTPMLGNSSIPTAEACSPLDDWLADQY
jgi:hypothetical protein